MILAHFDAPALRPAPGRNRSPARSTRAPGAPAASLDGEAACLCAYERIRHLAPASWSRLAIRRHPDAVAGHGEADIAEEIRRTLQYGASRATPQALMLLAGLALRHQGPHQDAHRLAAAALDMAERFGATEALRALHAAIVTPFAGGFEQAVCELVALCGNGAPSSATGRALPGTALVGGMPLPELARRLAPQAGAASLLRTLLHGASGPVAPDGSSPQSFGDWLAGLQAAVYGEALPQALEAIDRLAFLACPAVPLADRLCHHLFAAQVLARADGAAAAHQLTLHCAALRRLARHLPDAAAMSMLADAARAGREGNPLAALGGCEDAGAMATRRERHWLAALAWEAAARQAALSGLGSAVSHYRRAALASYGYWGALGRIDTLRRRWQDPALDGGGRAARLLGGCGLELGLSIAHEVNQPLAAIALHAAAARKWLRRPQPDIERALSSLALIGDAGRHAGDIVRSMQDLATRAGSETGAVVVDQAVSEVLQLLRHRLRKGGIRVELALGLGESTIHASRTQLRQVLTNLLANAIDALGADGAPAGAKRIRIESQAADDGAVQVSVSDNGPGIPPQLRERVFGSLFSTKPHSTGMGLAISQAIVRAHGGQLCFEPALPHGACFRLRLPLDGAGTRPQTAGEPPDQSSPTP